MPFAPDTLCSELVGNSISSSLKPESKAALVLSWACLIASGYSPGKL